MSIQEKLRLKLKPKQNNKSKRKSKQKKPHDIQKSIHRRETILDIIDIAIESLSSWWLWL